MYKNYDESIIRFMFNETLTIVRVSIRKAQKRKATSFSDLLVLLVFSRTQLSHLFVATNVPRFLLPLASRPVDSAHDSAQEPASAELHLPDNANVAQEPEHVVDGRPVQRQSYTFLVSLRDMRQGLPASRHFAETHATRVRQGAQVQVPVLRPQDQATWQFVSAYPHQSSRKERLLQHHLVLVVVHVRSVSDAVFPICLSIFIFYPATLYACALKEGDGHHPVTIKKLHRILRLIFAIIYCCGFFRVFKI